MTWKLALFHMQAGGAVSRPHWKFGQDVRIVNIREIVQIMLFENNKPVNVYSPSPADISAADWQKTIPEGD